MVWGRGIQQLSTAHVSMKLVDRWFSFGIYTVNTVNYIMLASIITQTISQVLS